MKEVAEYVNEKKRLYENRSKVLQIQSAFDGKAEVKSLRLSEIFKVSDFFKEFDRSHEAIHSI